MVCVGEGVKGRLRRRAVRALGAVLLALLCLAVSAAAVAGGISLDCREAELDTILTIFSELSGLVFIRGPEADARLTVVTTQPVALEGALDLLHGALDANGLAMVVRERTALIVPAGQAKSRDIPVVAAGPEADALGQFPMITQFLQTFGLDSRQVVQLLQPFVSPRGIIFVHEGSGSVVVVDAAANARRLEDLQERLAAVSPLSDLEVRVFTLRYADETKVADALEELVSFQEVSDPGGAGGAGGRAGGKVRQAAFIPDARLGAVVAIGRKAVIDRAEEMVGALDSKALGGFWSTVVRRLNYADAEAVVSIVETLADADPQEERQIVAAVDERTNSVVLCGPADDLAWAEVVIAGLDGPAPQVRLEVVIAQLTREAEWALGLSGTWADVPTAGGNDPGHFVAAGADLGAGVGVTYSVIPTEVGPLGEQLGFGGRLRALAGEGQAAVYTAPRLLVADATGGSLSIVEEVPVPRMLRVDDRDAVTEADYEYRDVGVQLEFTPRVGPESVEVSIVFSTDEIGSIDSVTGQYRFQRREGETNIVAPRGRTIAIAGLLRLQRARARSWVPGLGEVPLLGRLLGSDVSAEEESRLVVFVTATPLEEYEENSTVGAEGNTGAYGGSAGSGEGLGSGPAGPG